jgi:hypothetical protein
VAALFTLYYALTLDVIVAVAMIVVEVFVLLQILPRSGPPPPITRMVIGSSALLASSGVLMALLQAFLNSNLSSYSVVLLVFNFMMMGPPGFWFLSLIAFEDRTIRPDRWFWPVAVTAMVTAAELLMGLFFAVAGATSLALDSILASTLTTPWFLWSMAAPMVALLFWLPLPRTYRDPLLGLAAVGVVAPVVPVDPLLGAALMAAAMATTMLWSLHLVRLVRVPAAATGRVLLGVAAAFLAMSVSGAASALFPSSTPVLLAFGLVMAVVMTTEFLVLVREGFHPTTGSSAPSVSQTRSPVAPAGSGARAAPSRP